MSTVEAAAEDEGTFIAHVLASVPRRAETEGEIIEQLFKILRAALNTEQRMARLVVEHPEIADEDELLDLIESAFAHTSTASRTGEGASSGFTEHELAVFEEAAIDVEAVPQPRARRETDVAATRLLVDALTVSQAADHLGVDQSRVRQRLNERTLYGLKVGRSWRLPRFQFTEQGEEVPNIGGLLAALPEEMHPLSVQRWLTTPKPDLWLDGPTSPRRWLLEGGDPQPVMELARYASTPI